EHHRDQRHQPDLLPGNPPAGRLRRRRHVHRRARGGGRPLMIGILVVSHEPLGTALIRCTRHGFVRLPPQLAALDVLPDEDPRAAVAAARELLARINDGSGALVFTDCWGATPSRIAAELADPRRIHVLAGVNLPMLLKAITLR